VKWTDPAWTQASDVPAWHPAPPPEPAVRTQEVRVVENLWISLSDGTRLAARAWFPFIHNGRIPCILEAIPYRKSDVTVADDAVRHAYFAGHGYACVRLDLRGSGDSEGVLQDEYHPQEQADICEVIAWLAEQDWCSGEVGMIGISWSGFNGLQVAACRPPQLKAVVTVCSTDDRYDNDVHYMGGNVLAFYMLVWAAVMLHFNARPPDPEVFGDAWHEEWLRRLENNVFLGEKWLAHQRRDDYWRQGSVCENYPAIECPVLAVGGWADAYVDAILRLMDGLPGVRKAIIGPWGHTWPERGVPGPSIGFLQECLRWWDRWLKGVDTGVEAEPLIRYWMQDPVPPLPNLSERPGRWVAARSVPGRERIELALLLGEGGDGDICSPLTVGAAAGSWLPYGNPTDLPGDQRVDDAGSLVYDFSPLTEPLEVFGQPMAELTVSADRPQAQLMVRLCHVAPTGESVLITRGALNLTHRDSREHPSPLEPGRRYAVRIPLKATASVVPAGHRLRLAISTSYWPWLWPAPELATVSVASASLAVSGSPPVSGSRLVLPLPDPADADLPAPVFGPAEIATPIPVEELREHCPVIAAEGGTFRLRRDLSGKVRYPSGLVYSDYDPTLFRVDAEDPLSASVELFRRTELSRPVVSGTAWSTRIETEASMTCDKEFFHISATQRAYEGEVLVHSRDYGAAIPRDHG
jgi:predicted acyl esterase